MVVIAESMAGDRHYGTEALTKSLHLIHSHKAETEAQREPHLGIAWAFETSKSAPKVANFLYKGQIFSNKVTSPNFSK